MLHTQHHFLSILQFMALLTPGLAGLIVEGCPEVCECLLDDTVLCVKKELLVIPNDIPNTTRVLNLHGNYIEDIPIDSLRNFSELTTLILNSNRLTAFPINVTEFLPNLKHLELRDNRLTIIPSGLRQLTALEKLDLRLNAISVVTEADLYEIAQVKVLDLAKNRIRRWPTMSSAAFPNTQLNVLDLSSNDIFALDINAFRIFKRLTTLRLARNKLDRVERMAFGESIKTLDLSRNRIRKITSLNFDSLSQLEYLLLHRNQIDVVEAGALHGVNNLHLLNLSSNRLKYISEGLFGQSNLTKLDLSSNEFRHVNEKMWAYVENLQWLSLARNQISELEPYAFRPLNHLVYLSLTRNQLRSVSKKSFIGLNALDELDMSGNELAVCVEDGSILQNTSLVSLRKLDFSSNLIGTIPPFAFAGFKNLQELDLSDNQIVSLSEGAFEPLRLRTLKLSTVMMSCDCKIAWFAPWLSRANLNPEDVSVLCDHPPSLYGHNVLHVNTTNLVCSGQSPQAKITMDPLPLMMAQNGKNVRLFCKGYGSAPLHVQWRIFENDRDRILEEDSSLHIHVNHTIDEENPGNEYVYSELLLQNVTLMDEAEYQCTVRNRHGSAYSHHSVLRIRDLPVFVMSPPADLAIRAGMTALIPCRADGIPEPTLSYQKDQKNVFPALQDRRVFVKERGEGLYLLKVVKADEGVYTCIATNDAGTATASMRLHVFEYGFSKKLKNRTVKEQSPLILFCPSEINTLYKIRWFHNDSEITADNDMGVAFKGASNEMLVITAPREINTGRYRCELRVTEKQLLLQEQSALVTVEPKNFNGDSALYVPDHVLTATDVTPEVSVPVFLDPTDAPIVQPSFEPTGHNVTQTSITTTTRKQFHVPRFTAKRPHHRTPAVPTVTEASPEEYSGFFAVVYQAFMREFNSWNYPYRILLILLVVFAALIIVCFCYCAILRLIGRRCRRLCCMKSEKPKSNHVHEIAKHVEYGAEEKLIMTGSIGMTFSSVSQPSTNSTTFTVSTLPLVSKS